MSGISSNLSISVTNSLASVTSLQNQPSLQPFANLNLTEQQRTQIRSIFQNAKQGGQSAADVQNQIDSVLTPQQQQALQSDIKSSGHHHHDGEPSSRDNASASTAATSSSSSVTPTASPSTLDLIANVQNQATAAQSTLDNTLQQEVTQNGQGQS